MRKWAEVIDNLTLDASGQPTNELIACLDVTDESDGGQAVLADLMIVYPGLLFRWHECFHDMDKSCRIEAA